MTYFTLAVGDVLLPPPVPTEGGQTSPHPPRKTPWSCYPRLFLSFNFLFYLYIRVFSFFIFFNFSFRLFFVFFSFFVLILFTDFRGRITIPHSHRRRGCFSKGNEGMGRRGGGVPETPPLLGEGLSRFPSPLLPLQACAPSSAAMRCFQSSVSSFWANRIPPPSNSHPQEEEEDWERVGGDPEINDDAILATEARRSTPPLTWGGVIKGGTRSYEGKHIAPETCGAGKMCDKSSSCGKRGYPLEIQISHHPTFPGEGDPGPVHQSATLRGDCPARLCSSGRWSGGGIGQPPPNGGSLMIVVTFHRSTNQVAIFMKCDFEPRRGPTIQTRFTLVASNQRFLGYRFRLSRFFKNFNFFMLRGETQE